MKTILCLTDFSANSNNAMKYAAGLAESLKSKLILVHGYESPVMYTEQPFATVQLAGEQTQMLAEKKLTNIKSKLQKDHTNLNVDFITTEGASSDHLVSIIDHEKAELVIMGTTTGTKLQRLFMGSTTAAVIRKAHCPILSVPEHAKFNGIKKIIFSTDLHEDNLNSAVSIASFAKHFDAEIIFLYVNDKHLMHTDEEVIQMTSKIRTHINYTKISGYISQDPHINEGINYFLKKHPADLLVMFTYPRHFPEALFHPGLTKIMSHQTKIPMLSMKFSDTSMLA
jgi:nucleotide-binding universal stress UspA family protein